MNTRSKQAGQAQVRRVEFVRLLTQRLQFRWLSRHSIPLEALVEFFPGEQWKDERVKLTRDLVRWHQSQLKPSPAELSRLLNRHSVIRLRFKKRKAVSLSQQVVETSSASGGDDWPTPPIPTEQALADFLGLPSASVLDWLTLPHRRRRTRVDHYVRRSQRKRDGRLRWIETPRPVLKRVQRILKSELFELIPLHPAAHGFRTGHSAATAAAPHVGRQIVLRMDLQNFFGRVRMARVRCLLQVAGYSPSVATAIARLSTAPGLRGDHDLALRSSRLPQGSPTSPAIANAIAFRLDRRLAHFSARVQAHYTRYADDLIFSGDELLAQRVDRFSTSVAAIALDEGFQVNFRKTAVMRRGGRQQALGLVLNDKLQSPRREYETLKAILTNGVRHGLDAQNRDDHPHFLESLRGRIAYVAATNPNRGDRLRKLFERARAREASP